jgi:hypothetical protein
MTHEEYAVPGREMGCEVPGPTRHRPSRAGADSKKRSMRSASVKIFDVANRRRFDSRIRVTRTAGETEVGRKARAREAHNHKNILSIGYSHIIRINTVSFGPRGFPYSVGMHGSMLPSLPGLLGAAWSRFQ